VALMRGTTGKHRQSFAGNVAFLSPSAARAERCPFEVRQLKTACGIAAMMPSCLRARPKVFTQVGRVIGLPIQFKWQQ
jgi:hypothetical protein